MIVCSTFCIVEWCSEAPSFPFRKGYFVVICVRFYRDRLRKNISIHQKVIEIFLWCGSHNMQIKNCHCCTAGWKESTAEGEIQELLSCHLFFSEKQESFIHKQIALYCVAFILSFSPGLGGFLRRVCCLGSCGPPTALLCQQHRRFFWRKWKNSHSHNVVRPAAVRPAYVVPKVQ